MCTTVSRKSSRWNAGSNDSLSTTANLPRIDNGAVLLGKARIVTAQVFSFDGN